MTSRPDLLSSPNSDLFLTAQAWAGSKPLTVPVQTSYKSSRTERRCVYPAPRLSVDTRLTIPRPIAGGTNGSRFPLPTRTCHSTLASPSRYGICRPQVGRRVSATPSPSGAQPCRCLTKTTSCRKGGKNVSSTDINTPMGTITQLHPLSSRRKEVRLPEREILL